MIDPNLPAGAQFDPRAPFNESDEILCRSCDADQINQMWWAIEEGMIGERTNEERDWELTPEQEKEIEDAEDTFRSQFRQCRECMG
jgi:hypothetical protein